MAARLNRLNEAGLGRYEGALRIAARTGQAIVLPVAMNPELVLHSRDRTGRLRITKVAGRDTTRGARWCEEGDESVRRSRRRSVVRKPPRRCWYFWGFRLLSNKNSGSLIWS